MTVQTKSKYTRLNPEFKAKWLKALRSGRYKQTIMTLRNKSALEKGYRYCCVGVACNIVDPKQWASQGPTKFSWGRVFASGLDRLPFLNEDTFRELADLNDNKGWNFNQIADWIEENL